MLYHCVGISDSDNKNLYCSLIVPPKIKKTGLCPALENNIELGTYICSVHQFQFVTLYIVINVDVFFKISKL